MNNCTISHLVAGLSAVLLLGLVGCVEESSTIVTFDTRLESTTFTNKLLTPLVLYRDNQVLDTIPASTARIYPLGRKGVVNHRWRIIPPIDRFGKVAGISAEVNLGVQYQIRAEYRITNESVPSETIFTPMVANFSPYSLRLIANYDEEDEVLTEYLIPRDINAQLAHSPYYYWNSASNIRLESTTTFHYYEFSRLDTTSRQLRLDTRSEYDGSGRTEPVTVY